jgi:excisionase family DNA binding protein
METVPARQVDPSELDRLDKLAASFTDSSLRAAVSSLVCTVRSGTDAVVAAKDEYLTPAQAAKLLGMSRGHLYKVLDAGMLPWIEVGRDRRLAIQDVLEFRTQRRADKKWLAERFAHADVARRSLVESLAERGTHTQA